MAVLLFPVQMRAENRQRAARPVDFGEYRDAIFFDALLVMQPDHLVAGDRPARQDRATRHHALLPHAGAVHVVIAKLLSQDGGVVGGAVAPHFLQGNYVCVQR